MKFREDIESGRFTEEDHKKYQLKFKQLMVQNYLGAEAAAHFISYRPQPGKKANSKELQQKQELYMSRADSLWKITKGLWHKKSPSRQPTVKPTSTRPNVLQPTGRRLQTNVEEEAAQQVPAQEDGQEKEEEKEVVEENATPDNLLDIIGLLRKEIAEKNAILANRK